MTTRFIATLFILLIVVLFAVQNAGEVTVNLLFWNVSVSLAVVLMICIICGALIGSAITMFSVRRKAAKSLRQAEEKTGTPVEVKP